VNYALEKVSSEVRKRSSGKASSSGKTSGGGAGAKKDSGSKGSGGSGSDKDVIVLTGQNFDDLVLGSKDIWFVEFYAPWCGHCKNLEPEWNQAATTMKGQVKFGKVDATVEQALAQRYRVQGYPTIKVFDYGEGKTDSSAKDYEGGRDAASLVARANQLLEKADVQPEIHELVNQKIYDSRCSGQVICIISFLPNIYDSNAAQRNAYL